MEIAKYQKMIFEGMRVGFSQWESKDCISERVMYHLLHRLKGTAGTIGLHELTHISNKKLKH